MEEKSTKKFNKSGLEINLEVENQPKKKDKKKLFVIIAIVLALLIGGGIYGYSTNEKKKADAQKNAFNDITVEVKEEYSDTIPLTKESTVLNTKDMVEVLKNGKTDENTKISKADTETIDTSKEAEYTVSYTVETLDELGNKATKKYKETFVVANSPSDSPVITLKKTKVEITVGDKYDASENIKSVKDGNGEDIKKVDSKPTESGTAYYLIDVSKLDTSKAGEYKVTVSATLSSGATTSKDFTVTVKVANSTTDKKSSDSTKSTNGTKSADSTKNTSKKTNSSSTKSTDGTNSANSTSNSQSSSNTQNNSANGTTNSGGATTNSGSATQTCKEVDNGYWENYVTKEAWDETVVDQEAWDETVVDQASYDVVQCVTCGERFAYSDYDGWENHALTTNHGNCTVITIPAQTHKVHHDAVTHTVHHDAEYGQRWVPVIEKVCS